jgi:glycogen operon protein
MMSIGVPMISGGDEIGRTQHGNNNGYAQDNEVSWTHWDLTPDKQDLLDFTVRLVRLWRENPVLRRRKFLQGRRARGADVTDITWLDANGREMDDHTWNAHEVRCLGMRLNGDAIDEADERGERVVGDTLMVMLNAHATDVPFMLPGATSNERWETLIDTAEPDGSPRRMCGSESYLLKGRSVAVLRLSARAPHNRRKEDKIAADLLADRQLATENR